MRILPSCSLVQFSYTTWTLTKLLEKKLDENYRMMLYAVLNKSWKQLSYKTAVSKSHPRKLRHAGHYWRSRNELISNVLLLTLMYAHTSIGQPAKTEIHQLCVDAGCSLKDLLSMRADKDRWWERAKEIHVIGIPWWWWFQFKRQSS